MLRHRPKEIACCCARAWSSTISDIADEVSNLPAISDTRWRSVTGRAAINLRVTCSNQNPYPMSFEIVGGSLLLQSDLEQHSIGHSIRGKQPSGNL
ncbi:hypothetical protein TIFTF001_046029 [Ficus carica]|uniref:Uncharacterized protein n=1 Tax=Ficus carica TaxID=3494 RepID=A0AA87ZGZ0_FICCA|nr:hypothetical protein TIFTF001_046029 [Ficus carica]